MILSATAVDANAYPVLLNDTIEFFKDLKKFFERELSILKGSAQALTRFVTAFDDEVALCNIDKSLSKIELTGEGIEKQPRRIVHFLSRAQEFLAKTTQNNVDAAQFIPNKIHQRIAQQNQELLGRCNTLIERSKTVISGVPDNTKSWLPLHINLAILLSDIYAAGYGLAMPEEHEHAVERLVAIEAELATLSSKSDKANITKASKRKVGCASFASEPQAKEFHEHVPPLLPVFDSFKRMILQHENKVALTKEIVHAAIDTKYPKPM